MNATHCRTPMAVDPRQRRQVRRSAAVLALVALAVYVSFIAYSVLHGHR